jgi:hypothetical protein
MFADMAVEEAVAPSACATLETQYKKQLRRSKNKDLTRKQREAAAVLATQLKAQYDACMATSPVGPAPVPIPKPPDYSGAPWLDPIPGDFDDTAAGGGILGGAGGWKTWGLVAAIGLGAYFMLRKK